ncbi:hypothetical protein Tco_0851615 [Tanacetum coccineum]
MVTDPPPTDSTIMPAPRKKLDSEFNEEEKTNLRCTDTQAEIILSQGLSQVCFSPSLNSESNVLPRVFGLMLKALLLHPLARQNVAFVFENIAATNDDSTSYDVSNSSGHNSQCEHPSSYSFLANQSSFPQLDHEDLK